MLKHLKRVAIQFHPSDLRSTAARELLSRVGNEAARKSNPDCAVEVTVAEGPVPAGGAAPASSVELQFADGETHRLSTGDLTVADIVKLITQKATEMELRGVMKDVGFDPFAAAGLTAGGKQQQQQQQQKGGGK